MADKYIKVASLKNKLNYIFRNYGTSKVIRDKVNEAIKSVPCYFKAEFDTTLEVADVQEVKHGKWESTELMHENGCTRCSECKTEYYASDLEKICGDTFPTYCPLCGARMDGVLSE